MPDDIRDLDRRAVLDSVRFIDGASPSDLDRPTPCAGWDLRQLLAHMAVQHRGFAATARGHGMDADAWRPASDVADLIGDYRRAADEVIEAFAEDGVLDRSFGLAEFSTEVTFPAERAIGFHLVDYVVHSWDVARTLGEDYRPDADVADAALDVALAVPNGPEHRQDGAAFAPGEDLGPGVAVIDRIVAWLGRTPGWTP